MIARIWRCTTSRENVKAYLAYFEASVLPQASALDGFSQVYIFERETDAGAVELTLVSHWKTMDAIREYAGEDVEAAVVAADAQTLLQSYDERVTHHTVLMHAGPDVPSPDLPDAAAAG